MSTTMTAPHHAVYVTVAGGLAHRPGPSTANRHTAACSPLVNGHSCSYAWAAHLGYTPCDAPACYPPEGSLEADRLWMATRRKGLNHHRLPVGVTKTGCARWAGENEAGEFDNGLVITAAEAIELESKPCKQCWPVIAGG